MKSEFCTNCGTKLDSKGKFCSSCGKPVAAILEKTKYIELQKAKSKSGVKNEEVAERSTARKILGFIAAFCVYAFARAAGTALGLSFSIIVLLGLLLGWAASKLADRYVNKGKIKRTTLKLWAWSNLITWLIPVIGIFTAVFTLKISMHMQTRQKLFHILAFIGIIALIINGTVGAIQGAERREKMQELEQLKSSLDLQEKQLNECSAAIEAKRSSLNLYSQVAVYEFNSEVNSCNAIRETYKEAVDDYNSRL